MIDEHASTLPVNSETPRNRLLNLLSLRPLRPLRLNLIFNAENAENAEKRTAKVISRFHFSILT